MDALSVTFITGVFAASCAIKFIHEPGSLTEIMKAAVKNPAISVLSAILPLILGLIIVVSFGPSFMLTRADALAVIIGAFLVANGLFRLWAVKMWRALVDKMSDKRAPHFPMSLMLIVGIVLMLIGVGIIPIG